MDGPRLARSFWRRRHQVWSGHVFGLLVRPDDRWPRWVSRIGLRALRRAVMRDDGAEFPNPGPDLLPSLRFAPCSLSGRWARNCLTRNPLASAPLYGAVASERFAERCCLTLSPEMRMAQAMRAVLAACWRGPVQARVDKVEVVEAGPAALGSGFRQIATR